MDRGADSRMLADVELPGGGVVQVRVVEGSDGLGSAGLGERLHLDDALAQIGVLATLVRESLEPVKPTRATVQFGVGFSITGGRLTSLIVDGKGEASLLISLEWDGRGSVTSGR
jgi:hypothetical protein